MDGNLAAAYKSQSQRARIVTERWGQQNLYCCNCSASRLFQLRNNSKAGDFECTGCGCWYQLKSQRGKIQGCVAGGAYQSMMEAIRNDRTPNFYFLQYEWQTWQVKNLLLVPHFAFPPSAILKRKPLSLTARRAGWIGCNISLQQIPADARIPIIVDGNIVPTAEVRKQFRQVKPLKDVPAAGRGWTLEVLAAIRSLNRAAFSTKDAYALAPGLQALHPANRHVSEKIRQQLQVLRDIGFLVHLSRGEWKLKQPITLDQAVGSEV